MRSDDFAAGRYNLHSESSKCYEGDVSGNDTPLTQCTPGSMLCSGGVVTNYVYRITESPK